LARRRAATPAPDYAQEIRRFARAWESAGYALPAGFDSADARPPTVAEREYQLQRGPGHGRGLAAIAVVDAQTRAGLAPPAAEALALAEAGERLTHEDESDDDSETLDAPQAPVMLASPSELTVARLASEGPPTVDVRAAGEAASLLIFICVVGQPLIYAHVNGFSIIGFEAPSRAARPACLLLVQRLVDLVVGALCYAFMVGEYRKGARLFTAPIGARPPPETVVRTPAGRRRAQAARLGFVWCTLAALQGTAVEDAAARAVLSASAFVGPTEHLADAPLPTSTGATPFTFGAAPATLMVRRPPLADEQGPAAWSAIASLLRADQWLSSALDAAAF
jgi:hypothetical protein